jgi:hypothetical protein
LVYTAVTFCGRPSQGRSAAPMLRFGRPCYGGPWSLPYPSRLVLRRLLVWAVSGSLAATRDIDVSFFSSGYSDVSFPQVPSWLLLMRSEVPGVGPGGLPHSEIDGSRPTYGSPSRFGVGPVLLRPVAPRHPPCAFVCFSAALSPCCAFPGCAAFFGLPWPLFGCQGSLFGAVSLFGRHLRVYSSVLFSSRGFLMGRDGCLVEGGYMRRQFC